MFLDPNNAVACTSPLLGQVLVDKLMCPHAWNPVTVGSSLLTRLEVPVQAPICRSDRMVSSCHFGALGSNLIVFLFVCFLVLVIVRELLDYSRVRKCLLLIILDSFSVP